MQSQAVSDQPRDGVLVVVDRRSSPAQAVAVALFLAAVLLLALFARKRALLALFAGVRAVGELAADVPFVAVPRAVEGGALLVVLLAPVVVWFLLARWARRSARVEVGHDEVVLDRPLGPWLLDDRRVVLAASTIESVEAAPTGLRLRAASVLGPLTVVLPVLDPAEQAAAVRALDAARDPAREAGRALAGERVVPTRASTPTLVAAVLSFFACASVELVLGLPASLLLVGVWIGGVVTATRRLSERHAQVLAGARRLAVADAVAPWSAVREVAVAGSWLAADLGPYAGPTRDGRRLARLTPEARERLLPLLRERLGERLTSTLPAWAARRATRGALLAPHLVAVVAGLTGLLALPLVHDLYVWTDHRGQELRLLVRRLDRSLRRVVVCPVGQPGPRQSRSLTGPWSSLAGSADGPALARGRVEWPDGRTAPTPRDARVVVVGATTVTCDTRLRPSPRDELALRSLLGANDGAETLRALRPDECVAALARYALAERSPLLADVADGRRGSLCDRVFQRNGPRRELLWSAEEGRVTALFVINTNLPFEPPCWCLQGRLAAPARLPERLPPLDRVVEARDQIEAGVSFNRALEPWALELTDRPAGVRARGELSPTGR